MATYRYDVCLSFASEDRTYVELVAAALRDIGISVFYDKYEASNLWLLCGLISKSVAQVRLRSLVLRHLTDIKEHTHERGTVYETGSFDDWQVTVVEAGMGNDRAAVETERAITHADPQVVFFVGIAGGLKDADLGDVVAAETVYGYERGKQGEQFLSRPNVGLSSYALVQRARAEAKKDAWKIRMKNPAETARVFVGPLAAGEKVLTSNKAALREFLRQHYNDALAIEMEGRGFLAATYANHQTNAIVIRGISDLLENKSDGDAKGMQEIAADHATAFAFEVLAHF